MERVFVHLSLQPLMALVEQYPGRVRTGLRQGVARTAARVVSEAKLNASGRPGPRVRTGTLRRSIHALPVVEEAPLVFSTRVGAATPYARRLEFGFQGTVNVRAHQRRAPVFVTGGLWDAYRNAAAVRHQSGRLADRHRRIRADVHEARRRLGVERFISVAAYSYEVNAPAYPFLRPALTSVAADGPGIFRESIAAALMREKR